MSALTVFLIVFGMDSGLVVFEHPTMETCQAEFAMSDPKIFPRVDPSDLVGGGMKERFPSWKDDEEVVEATRSELKPEDAEFVAGHIEALHGSGAWKRAQDWKIQRCWYACGDHLAQWYSKDLNEIYSTAVPGRVIGGVATGSERERVLAEALRLVSTVREESHGEPRDQFGLTARLWTNYLVARHGEAVHVTASDVAIMMCLLKISRHTHGTINEDNYVDLAGYAALARELL